MEYLEIIKNFKQNHSGDLAEGAIGILQVPVFSGSFRNATFERNEYYLVEIIDSTYSENDNLKHWFKVEVLEVLNGITKKVGETFRKQGKNLYPNFYTIKSANEEALNVKHEQKAFLTEVGGF